MPSSAVCSPRVISRSRRAALRKAFALAGLALAFLSMRARPAAAQSCAIPPLNDDVCISRGGSIDDYIACYRDLYDQNVIPAFTAMAQCSHVKAGVGIRAGLEAVGALVTGAIKNALAGIDQALNVPGSAPSTCIGDLNAVEETLRTYIEGERAAPDLDAYRRSHYTPGHLTFFADVLLAARQGRAACDGPLQTLRKNLVLLSNLKAQHLDYCQIMRQSASYQSVARIDALAQWTTVDPDLHFDNYFNISISLNAQCGYYDFSGGGPGVLRYESCNTLTGEYRQTLVELDGVLGWLSSHRNVIVPVAAGVAATIFSAAGAGAAAGPYGAAVGAAVGLAIAGLEYLAQRNAIEELNDLIAAKEQELNAAVAANLITEPQFDELITAKCTPWKATIDQRVQSLLAGFDVARHVETLDGYYALSDRLNDWYNELFLWSITPGPDGTRFIDELAQQDLLAKKDTFDQRVFAARATQEIADRKTTLTNIKATVSLLSCSNLTAGQKRIVKNQLNAGVSGFNRACSTTMDALAVQPDEPVAFASGAASTVICSYNGFRNGVTTLEISDGEGFASNLTLRGAAGEVLAQLTNVTSDTDFGQTGVPGLRCASSAGQEFGKAEDSRLAATSYPVRVQDNLFGFRDIDAAALRTDVQSLDGQLRFKAIVCARQMGTTFNTPRTATACGIPPLR
ncbi:MAG: hypothetical protein R3B48_19580 [Kofleriaceae bacterium]